MGNEHGSTSESDALFRAFYEFSTGRDYLPRERMPKSQRGRINEAVKEAIEAGISADQVEVRGAGYAGEWSGMERSPQALLMHWERFDPETIASDAACTHRYSDGATALSVTTQDGVDVRRCGKCYAEQGTS